MSRVQSNMANTKKSDNAEPWKTSVAKKLLREDIERNFVTNDVPAKTVYDMRIEYSAYEFKNFKTNLKNLRAAIARNRLAAVHNMMARESFEMRNRITNSVNSTLPVWHKTEAPKLLAIDVANGLHETMKPRALWKSRVAYMQFDAKKFNNHLYSFVKNSKARAYWMNKKSKSSKK